MKFTKKLFAGLWLFAAVLCAIPASAQVGFDTFTPVRLLPFTGATTAKTTNIFTAGTVVTNGPIDKSLFTGRSTILIAAGSNITTTGTLTAQVYGSPDTTNFYALTNYAVVTNTTSFIATNGIYTNLTITNTPYLPGTLTTPTAYSAGYATPYLAALPFTNGGAITLPLNPDSITQFAFPMIDQYRYLYIVWTPSATSGTNLFGNAWLLTTPINNSGD